jgi:hypothetical protein
VPAAGCDPRHRAIDSHPPRSPSIWNGAGNRWHVGPPTGLYQSFPRAQQTTREDYRRKCSPTFLPPQPAERHEN